METKIVSTDEFWEVMSDFRFVRLTELQGRIGNTLYICTQPPEKVCGFLSKKIKGTLKHLGC